jgi:lycopene beta-cyclase
MHSSQVKHFDYIFAGSGLAALMTVCKMVLSNKFADKSILLLDFDSKKSNDRTWCFWDQNVSIWNSIKSKKWDLALFANENFKRVLDLKPYQYNQIRGLDFYNFVFESLSNQKNITFLNEKVTDINELDTHVYVATESQSYTCHYLFNSILAKETLKNQSKYPYLQQHFVGWFIKSETPIFNPEQATFMDFSVEQKGNTRFMYVLPTSENEALVEYTLFSKDLLPKEEYETEIQDYLSKLGVGNYEIIEKEQGSIPMTCYPFWKKNSKRVLNIGTAGGWTKASTGFTFKKTDHLSTSLVTFLESKSDFRTFYSKSKFWFYDLLLLDILDQKNELGSRIFSSLFQKGDTQLIFKFLDEETTFVEDIKVIWKCPKIIFIKALFRILLNPKIW